VAQGQLGNYDEMGLDQYEFEAAADCCSRCDELSGMVFDIADAEPGVNFPTIHPSCRCTVLPIIPDAEEADVEKRQVYAAIAKMTNANFPTQETVARQESVSLRTAAGAVHLGTRASFQKVLAECGPCPHLTTLEDDNLKTPEEISLMAREALGIMWKKKLSPQAIWTLGQITKAAAKKKQSNKVGD
jgi:hypothetical protein